ncbi:hypothetical protein H072_10374 [Dactylellina haptotyla CBS 200.50]|uniref:PHD-type domain-containing protein n=1 Tax=Dactylellina haptotyla (strain CBS 200.50) TaxID=1284197 RepID=S7ZZH5_DACHA|nr:hypothetical protein H072_10374 [Dactylellina haptotyla CBS 200.50]
MSDISMDEDMPDVAAATEILTFAIEIPTFNGDRDAYQYIEPRNLSVKEISSEKDDRGEQMYRVTTWDGTIKWLPWDAVIGMDFGNDALTEFEQRPLPSRSYHGDGAFNDDDYADDNQVVQIDSSDQEMVDHDATVEDEDDEGEGESEEEAPRSKRRSTRSSTAVSQLAHTRPRRVESRRARNKIRQTTLTEIVQRKSARSRTAVREIPAPRPFRSARASARTAGKLISQTVSYQRQAARANAEHYYDDEEEEDPSSDDLIISDLVGNSSRWKKKVRRATKVTYFSENDDDDDDDDDENEEEDSEEERRPTRSTRSARGTRGRPKKRARSSSSEAEAGDYGKRRSGRTAHARGSMRERDEDDIEVLEVKTSAPRVIYQQEVFKSFDSQEEFAQVHIWWCDACLEQESRQKGPLVHCQGCSTSLHRGCIGNRASREHLVTKLSDQEFVLQCKRCIRRAHKAEKRPPRLDVCTDCRQVGRSCEPFRKFPATKVDREQTPEIDVPGHQINNAMNVLFRCSKCRRGYHFHHLPARNSKSSAQETGGIALARLAQYSNDWLCIECVEIGDNKINDIIAWRPSDETLKENKDTFDSGISEFDHDELEFLVRMAGDDYSKARWYPGAWIYSVSFAQMRIAFEKHDPAPKWTTTDAIPESYFRFDIIFEVKYTSIVPNMSENVDKQRIREVESVYVKFKGLGYEEAMWVAPPSEDEEERYIDFKKAYIEYCKGNHVRIPRTVTKTIEALRERDFRELEIKTQPKYISGGTLKDYQMDGMNWLYNRWFEKKNAILADEMGLGKTIQIISFLEVLHQEHKVWPFLIVAPHSTVPNWIREIRTWAPSLRVVAYFGSGEALKLTKKYELFSNAPSASARDLKCHVVVTSYQAVADHSTVLKPVPWQALIVDEGQRLKSDDTILYRELWTFKFNYKVLLTGTPLQNNIRELFNLLQFLDPKNINAKELEEKFGEVNKDNLHELHDMIRPFFLRRTKAQALKDLPPISDIIVPLTVTKLQQRLYSSVLSKDAELIRAIMAKTETKSSTRSKLNNILVQLRKVLCHPFVYDTEVEEKLEDQQLVFRNLVDAGCKLKFLELLLPRLYETGHRVLMFSQFLHMLDVMEDFLNGLGLQTLRLDGSNDTAEKQKLIDAYNAPESPYFGFLLSTRAGGVGINLATADTVIILDPDYNPHQDLQAVARAHRIGQKNKVLVFHLITVKSVEERMIQLSKKKLGLDHLIIQRMGADGQDEEEEDVDVESILKYGAEDIMKGEIEEIKYDLESIDKLLDRSQMKETLGEQEQENQRDAEFSFARVWATEKGELTQVANDGGGDGTTPGEGDDSAAAGEGAAANLEFWDRIIQERVERVERAAKEAAERQAEYGRGRRKVTQTNYNLGEEDDEQATPIKATKVRKMMSDEDDTDFQETGGSDSETNSEVGAELRFDPGKELSTEAAEERSRGLILTGNVDLSVAASSAAGNISAEPQRMQIHGMQMQMEQMGAMGMDTDGAADEQPLKPHIAISRPALLEAGGNATNMGVMYRPPPPPPGIPVDCRLCTSRHMPGECPLRNIPIERCLLCGLAHFGEGPTCPHLGSITQLTAMLDTIKESNEAAALQAIAKVYLRGRKGAVTQARKVKKAKAERMAAEALAEKEAQRKGT